MGWKKDSANVRGLEGILQRLMPGGKSGKDYGSGYSWYDNPVSEELPVDYGSGESSELMFRGLPGFIESLGRSRAHSNIDSLIRAIQEDPSSTNVSDFSSTADKDILLNIFREGLIGTATETTPNKNVYKNTRELLHGLVNALPKNLY